MYVYLYIGLNLAITIPADALVPDGAGIGHQQA